MQYSARYRLIFDKISSKTNLRYKTFASIAVCPKQQGNAIYLWSQGWFLKLSACWSSSAFADSWILPTIQVYFSLDSRSFSHCVEWSTISFWHVGLHYACNLSYPLERPFSMSSFCIVHSLKHGQEIFTKATELFFNAFLRLYFVLLGTSPFILG